MSILTTEALLTYATTLAFYLHLRASEKYASRPDLLQKHPIMSRLLTLKQSLITLEELDFAPSDSDDDLDEDADAFDLWSKDKFHGLEWDELQKLLEDADDVLGDSESPKTRSRGKASTESEPKLTIKIKGKGKAKAVDEEVQADEPPKKKRKKSKVKSDSATEPALPVFDLVEPTFPSSSSSKSKPSQKASSSSSPSYDPYGEHLTLQQADAQDKASRKRSLRFHTSKIESSSAKREKARQGMGGDDDIPWKERKKAKEDRLAKEAAKKRGMADDDLDDTEPEPREDGSEGSKKKRKRAEEDGSGESDGEGDGDGGYYELVKQKSKEKKEQKKAEYDAVQAAIKYDLSLPLYMAEYIFELTDSSLTLRSQFDEDETADGPRSLTRAILKNKGLTPHRSKSIRNPRVKKRQRFEKAKKKISSQKAVYKGGVSTTGGRYDGEKSGISKVIKSVQL